jgi:hypothetical protein
MNVPKETLDALAEKVQRVNGRLLRVADYLRHMDAPLEVQDEMEAARRANITILHALIRAGADDPQEEWREEVHRVAGLPTPGPVPLHLLSSPTAKRYAVAMRAAAIACREMETERYGPGCDGFAESLEDWADIAELEVYGPKGLQGME